MQIFWGCVSFGLFLIGDINDWKWRKALLRLCFPGGVLLLAASTAGLIHPENVHLPVWGKVGMYVLSAAFLILLIDILFFSLPAGDAYVRQEEKRPVCTTGFYACCRHPGVLCFFLLYLCLWGGFGVPLTAVFVYSGLNVLLVLFEDYRVFPERLAGYAAYQKSTPFLLPDLRRLRRNNNDI